MKKVLPILTIIIIFLIILLLPRQKASFKNAQQVLSKETSSPRPTPSEYKERDQENFSGFLVPKDLK